MKKLMLVVVVAVALIGAADVQAKELLGAQLCGAAGCVTERAVGMLEGQNGPSNGELGPPAKPGAWYRGYLLAGDHGKVAGKILFYYVPEAGQVVQPGRFGEATIWTRPDGKLATLVAHLAERTKPFPTPRVTSVTLNGKSAADPQSYLNLWTLGKNATGYPDGLGSQQVMFFTDPASPWSDGNYVVAYPKSHLLLRDGQLVSLPDAVATRLAAGESLDVGRAIPWTLIAFAIATVALLAAFLRRLRPRTATRPVAQA